MGLTLTIKNSVIKNVKIHQDEKEKTNLPSPFSK
jgi:hypothetical protein